MAILQTEVATSSAGTFTWNIVNHYYQPVQCVCPSLLSSRLLHGCGLRSMRAPASTGAAELLC